MDFNYDFWCVSFTLPNYSLAYFFDRRLDSELYQHVRASTRPEGTTDEVRFVWTYARMGY